MKNTNRKRELLFFILGVIITVAAFSVWAFWPSDNSGLNTSISYSEMQDKLFNASVRHKSPPVSELAELDAEWNHYKNMRDAYEMDIPKYFKISGINIPLMIDEDMSYTYLYPAFRLYDPKMLINGRLNPDETFLKVLVHPVDIGDYPRDIALKLGDVDDHEQLLKLVQFRFADCIGGLTRKPTKFDGLYDMEISAIPDWEGPCFNNHYIIKYDPTKRRTLLVSLSQDCVITLGKNNEGEGGPCVTEDRVFDSFHFI